MSFKRCPERDEVLQPEAAYCFWVAVAYALDYYLRLIACNLLAANVNSISEAKCWFMVPKMSHLLGISILSATHSNYLQFQLPPHRSLDPSAGCSSSAGCAICFSLHLLPIPCRLRKVAFTLDYIHAGKQIFPEASTTPFLLYAFQGVLKFLTTIAILL